MAVIPYSASLQVSPGVTKLDPDKQAIEVAPGRVILFRMYVPPGPRGELSLWLKHQNSQLAPAPPSTWNNLDDDVVEFPLDYDVPPGETQFHLCGAAPDANFTHSVEFELLVDTSPQTATTQSPSSLTSRLVSALGLGG